MTYSRPFTGATKPQAARDGLMLPIGQSWLSERLKMPVKYSTVFYCDQPDCKRVLAYDTVVKGQATIKDYLKDRRWQVKKRKRPDLGYLGAYSFEYFCPFHHAVK